MSLPHKDPEIRTFEEMLLTEEERKERKKKLEADKALAAYYKKVFDDPEAFLTADTPSGDELPEDDGYAWDEDI